MKRVKLFFSLLMLATIIFSCATEGSSKEEVAVEAAVKNQDVNGNDLPTKEELAIQNEALMANLLEASDFELESNNGAKWEVEPESLKMILQVKQQIYVISGNMENYTIESYNMLGNEIFEFVNTIGELEDENANVQFQKIIKETKNQCVFLMGSELKNAQLAVINLSILYEEVPKYFGATEN